MFIHSFVFGVISAVYVEGQGMLPSWVLRCSFKAEAHELDNITFMFWNYPITTLFDKVGDT